MACARPRGCAARSRSREQGASPLAHVPRSLAPPATSARRSPQLRFVPADPVAHVVRKAKEARPPAPLDVLFASGNRSLVRAAAEATSSLFYNDASGSKGAADGLHDRYLRLRRVRRASDRKGEPLLQELHNLSLRGVLNTPFAATTVHASCRCPALASDVLPVTHRD